MNPVEKLALLRAEMKKRHLDAYVVVTDDFHASEYVGAHFRQNHACNIVQFSHSQQRAENYFSLILDGA